jgi:hypothetical protein
MPFLFFTPQKFFLTHVPISGSALCTKRILRHHPPYTPITKITNPAKTGYSPMNKPHFAPIFYNLYNTFRIALYNHKKGIKGTPNPKTKKGKQSGEGGLPPTDPHPRSGGDHIFRTHPPGDPVYATAHKRLVSSSPRFHSIGNKQSKSNSNGLLCPTHHNVSIDVTNRTRSSSNAVINNVHNYVGNYSLTPLHT